jgi:predicted site-specific integrase-resolvase
MPSDAPEMLTVTQVVSILECGRTTVYRMMDRGEIKPARKKPPWLRRPQKLYFARADVERLMRESREREAREAVLHGSVA